VMSQFALAATGTELISMAVIEILSLVRTG
jgi:hypothetical protein